MRLCKGPRVGRQRKNQSQKEASSTAVLQSPFKFKKDELNHLSNIFSNA